MRNNGYCEKIYVVNNYFKIEEDGQDILLLYQK